MLRPALLSLVTAFTLAACETGGNHEDGDKSVDRGTDAKPLSDLQAGIWIDPNGCDHWIIDDGVEGFLSPRLDRQGRPVCSGVGEPGTAVGDFKGGSTSIVGDRL